MLNESDGWHDVTFECRQKTKYRYLHVKLCIRLNEFLYIEINDLYIKYIQNIHGTAQIRQQKSMAILLLLLFVLPRNLMGSVCMATSINGLFCAPFILRISRTTFTSSHIFCCYSFLFSVLFISIYQSMHRFFSKYRTAHSQV